MFLKSRRKQNIYDTSCVFSIYENRRHPITRKPAPFHIAHIGTMRETDFQYAIQRNKFLEKAQQKLYKLVWNGIITVADGRKIMSSCKAEIDKRNDAF